jgi:hypothetical protein
MYEGETLFRSEAGSLSFWGPVRRGVQGVS